MTQVHQRGRVSVVDAAEASVRLRHELAEYKGDVAVEKRSLILFYARRQTLIDQAPQIPERQVALTPLADRASDGNDAADVQVDLVCDGGVDDLMGLGQLGDLGETDEQILRSLRVDEALAGGDGSLDAVVGLGELLYVERLLVVGDVLADLVAQGLRGRALLGELAAAAATAALATACAARVRRRYHAALEDADRESSINLVWPAASGQADSASAA
mmetsp:Transcript_80590/g.218239  ORF Transcript_80590/g.218239 Transcript_80590/m.218239 type:complete len:217 (-) Transcript_80590:80-730(-)